MCIFTVNMIFIKEHTLDFYWLSFLNGQIHWSVYGLLILIVLPLYHYKYGINVWVSRRWFLGWIYHSDPDGGIQMGTPRHSNWFDNFWYILA